MEALINRIAFFHLLLAAGLFLSGAKSLHAQSQSPLKTTPHHASAVPPPDDEGDRTVTLDNESEPQQVNGSSHAEPDSANGTTDEELEPADGDPESEPDPAVSAQQQLKEDFELYKNLLANDMTDEADSVAKRIVELSIRENGFESADTARALTNLAIVQHRNKDYETAQQNYQAAIGIIERVEDRLNADLINPLRGLGAAQLASGRPDLAIDTFNRARHVSHVNEGPHNLDQVGILESLAEIYIYVGEFEDAYNLQDRIYDLYARQYDPDSEDIIPALYKRAEWQHRLRLYGRERDTYRRIIKIIEKNQDKKSLALIRPLTGLANAYLFVGELDREYHRDNTMSTGEVYLKRANRIAEEHPDSNWQIRENTLLSLGDFYIFSDKAGKANRVYRDTWELLSQDESYLADRYDHLEVPVLLQDIYPPKYYGFEGNNEPLDEDEKFEQGRIVVKFMVNTRGRTRDYEIIEAYPAGLEDLEKDVLRDMRLMLYRPRMENGEVVDTENMSYTHEFFYRLSDLTPVDETEEQASPNIEDEEDTEDESEDTADRAGE